MAKMKNKHETMAKTENKSQFQPMLKKKNRGFLQEISKQCF